jgi:hypothetical protein
VSATSAGKRQFIAFARFGFVARGLLYIVIAFLVIGTGRTEDIQGAMRFLGHGAGWILLLVLAAGLAGYGAWRLSDAAFGTDSGRGDAEAWRKRAAAAGSGIIHLYLAWQAVRFAEGASKGASQSAGFVDGSELKLWVASAILLAAGAVQIKKAAGCEFLEKLDDEARHGWSKWLGRLGYSARGIIFLVTSFQLGSAAYANRHSAGDTGLEQALDWLAHPFDWLVAIGLMLFGIYSLIEAWHRRIHAPPVEQIKHEVREQLGS